MRKYTLQVYQHTLTTENEDTWVDINCLQINQDLTRELAELGIIEIRQGLLPAYQLVRVQKILRLHNNLGVNLTGAAIILDLLDKVEKLKDEIERLKRR